MGGDHAQKDRRRDGYLASLGLKVLRFNSREVLKERNAVIKAIYRTVIEQLNTEIPPCPPLKRGENMGRTRKLALMPVSGNGKDTKYGNGGSCGYLRRDYHSREHWVSQEG